jgi:site-specific DNA-adenine methylase
MVRKRRAGKSVKKAAADEPVVRLPVLALDDPIDCQDDAGWRFGAPILRKRNLWISPGGKVRMAAMLLKLLHVEHQAYTETFAGSAAVFFRKEKVPTEVLNDRDPEIAKAYSLVQGLSDADIELLAKMSWMGDRQTFLHLAAQEAKTLPPLERLYRYLYLSRFSFGKMITRGFAPDTQGKPTTIHKRLTPARDRLKGVQLYCGSYADAVSKSDGTDVLHYLDPPYPGYKVHIGESEFDENAFMDVLKSIKGKFLVTYGVRGKFPGMVKDSSFHARRVYPRRAFSAVGNMGSAGRLGTLIVSNYELTQKSVDSAFDDSPYLVQGWDEGAQELYEAVESGDLYRGINFRPTMDMSVLAKAALKTTDVAGPMEAIVEKVASRIEMSPLEVYRAANHLSSVSTAGDEATLLKMAVGGDAGAVWYDKKIGELVKAEQHVGRKYHNIGGLAFSDDDLVVQKDCVVLTDDGDVVFRVPSDEIHNLIEKSLPASKGVVQNMLIDGHHAIEHTPLYDLVLVPVDDFGQRREVVKMVGDFDYDEGDTGVASVQVWGSGVDENELGIDPVDSTGVVMTKLMLHKRGMSPDGHWEGGTLLTPRLANVENGLKKMAADGAGIIPMITEVQRAVGADGWGDTVVKGDLRKMELFDTPDVIAIRSGKLIGKQIAKASWVAGVQEDDYREFYFSGDLLDGRYVLMKVANDTQIDKAVWTTAYVNDLPDSAFLKIMPGGEKDAEGKTVPRSLRKFPYKNANGEIDLPHLRNAVARIPQAKELSDDEKERLQAKARKLLEGQAEEKAWVLAKFSDEDDTEPLAKSEEQFEEPEFCILRKDAEKRIVLGPVLIPEVVDLQGDIIGAEAIEKAAHEYLAGVNAGKKQGVQHEDFKPEIQVVESYIAPVDFEMNGRKILKGTWMLGFKILDDETWEQVKKGELRGFSIGGVANDSEKIGEDS